MCEPVSIVMAVVAIVGAVGGHMAQTSAANKQEQAVQDGIAADRAATAEQYKQINKAAMDDQAGLHTSYLIDSARIQAISAESGLQGNTQDRIVGEAENNSSSDMATLERNRTNQQNQARTQSAAQMNKANLQLAGIKRPSNVGTALQIGGAVASAYKPAPGDLPVTKPQGWDTSFDNPDNYG